MISFDEGKKLFRLDTANSTYCILISERGYLAHCYYGSKIGGDDVSYLTRQKEYGFSDSPVFREKLSLLDFLPQEIPTDGIGDFRESALAVKNSNGNNAVELKYKSHEIFDGTNRLTGLPCVFDSGNVKSQTLRITTCDEVLGIDADLFYTVFDDTDAIVRSLKITSHSKESVTITKALSASFDMDNDGYDTITLNGSWARERHIDRHPIHMGIQKSCSVRGETSHQEQPDDGYGNYAIE